MLTKLFSAWASRKADAHMRRSMGLVQTDWFEYRPRNSKPPEEDIVSFARPFMAPMLDRLSADPYWGRRDAGARFDLVYLVLRNDAETEVGRAKLAAMRKMLLQHPALAPRQ